MVFLLIYYYCLNILLLVLQYPFLKEGGVGQLYLVPAKIKISSKGKITEDYDMIPAFSFYHKSKIKEDRDFL